VLISAGTIFSFAKPTGWGASGRRFKSGRPDVSTFGKAAAAGFQIAGVVGRREIMESDVHPVGTFNANPISIAACRATISELEKPGVYEHMASITRRLIEGTGKLAKKKGITLCCDGVGSIWQLAFGITERMVDYRDNFGVDKAAYQKFRAGALERGIRCHPSRGRFYTSTAHTDEDVDRSLFVVEEVLGEMFQR